MKTVDMLLNCIRSEVFGTKFDGTLLNGFDDEQYKKLFVLSKKNDVAGIVASALFKNGFGEQNLAYKDFQKQLAIDVYRCEWLELETKDICAVLEKEQIPYVKLKGAVIRGFYPAAQMRTSCDIDILVHEEDIDKTVDALKKQLNYKAEQKRAYHDISLYSPSNVHLELHFSINENNPKLDKVLKKVWEYTYPVNEKSVEQKLTNEYLITHLVNHTAYHFSGGGCGMRPLIDLYLLRQQLTVDEDKLKQLLNQSKTDLFYENICKLCDVWFNGVPHTQTTMNMQNYLLQGGVYGSMSNKIAVAQLRQGGKIKYALQRVFMPLDNLKILYPCLQQKPFLAGFCQIDRWFKIVFGGRFKKTVNEFKITSNVDIEKAKQLDEMFKEIGL